VRNLLLATSGASVARSLIEGHHRFLKINQGDTDNGEVQHYVTNNQGVLANNRHFISKTAQEYQPNGDGTTEGQSLMVIGYAYAYMATGDPAYLAQAVWYWEAYVDYFYAGQPIPETPQRWICNWIVNAKEPVLANYPLNLDHPTQGGFKGIELDWVNGLTIIPHGAPTWGEYLDKATFAFEGVLGWDAINASVKAVYPSGSTDWDNDGIEYPVDWVILWTGDKVDWNGDVLSSGHPIEDHGTVQLKDTTVNGTVKFNYTTRNPVEHGGYMIPRNAVQHNRPIHTPIGSYINNMGNAADGELWFIDACKMLHDITGEDKYHKAMQSVLFTAYEYKNIDSLDMYFRQTTEASTPFTDGISYTWSYPDFEYAFDRDGSGYITIETVSGGDVSMEQQSISFMVSKDTLCQTVWGGITKTNSLPVSAEIELLVAVDKVKDNAIRYKANVPASISIVPIDYRIPLSKFTRMMMPNGNAYLTASASAVTEYGGVTYSESFQTISGDAVTGDRDSTVVDAVFASDSGGFIIGFWFAAGEVADPKSITYKSSADAYIKIDDADLWVWQWHLPSTNEQWVTVVLNRADLVLASWQGDHADEDVRPNTPNYITLEKMTVGNDNVNGLNFSYYCINDIPPVFDLASGYAFNYRITVMGDDAYNAVLGDCTLKNTLGSGLDYTPGVIPFSNIYEVGTEQMGAWHGLPYPGYQSPMMYALGVDSTKDPIYLTNTINFLYDSQQAYFNQFGVLGPGMSAYIWDRWDNVEYGSANTWTMYHWGDGHAWSGYQPRAYAWACRAWQVLVDGGKPVPTKLKDYCENWAKWLVMFTTTNNPTHVLPYEFPSASLPVVETDDFTGHMAGLWLAGSAILGILGSTVEGLDSLIEDCMTEIQKNYTVTDIPGHPMNGSWTPAARSSGDNGMFFGFWAAEILRGLGAYIIYKEGNHSFN